MRTEAKKGKFKKMYTIKEQPMVQVAANDEELDIRMEAVYIVLDRVSWFDRSVMKLYLAGHKMTEVSKKSGIAIGVLYQSIHKTKMILRDVLR